MRRHLHPVTCALTIGAITLAFTPAIAQAGPIVSTDKGKVTVTNDGKEGGAKAKAQKDGKPSTTTTKKTTTTTKTKTSVTSDHSSADWSGKTYNGIARVLGVGRSSTARVLDEGLVATTGPLRSLDK